MVHSAKLGTLCAAYGSKMNVLALVDFNLVASHGGIGRASRASGRPKTTLSRRIVELEESLGVRLVERGGHALRLTQEGQELHARTAELLNELNEAQAVLRDGVEHVKGLLRISASVVFSHVILGKIVANFSRAHPEVLLEIAAEDRVVSPVEDGYDLVFRIDPKGDEKLVGRCILRTDMLLVATPSFQKMQAESGVATLPAVVRNGNATALTVRAPDGQLATYPIQPVLRLTSLLMAHEAVLTGLGVAVLPSFMVRQDLMAGRLIMLGTLDAPPTEVWVLHSSRKMVPARVRAFMDFVTRYLESEV